MLNIDRLKIYLQELKMQNIWQVERDYIQHIILSAIYSNKYAVIDNNLVFKSGTDLQKQNIVDRFSIDLDFTSDLDFETLSKIFNYVNSYLDDLGISNTYSIEEKENSSTAKFNINGPVYESKKSDKAKVLIKLEISLKEQIIFEPRNQGIFPVYSDIKPYIIISMDINEIISEKIRAIMTRNKPRDVYDLWILIKKRYEVYEFLVRKKLQPYKIKFSLDEFITKINLKKKEWNNELKNLLNVSLNKDLPSFDIVKKDIIDYFMNNVSITAEFNLKNNIKKRINEKGFKFKISDSKLTCLVKENVKINESLIYPNFDSEVDVFAYKKYKALHLIVNVPRVSNLKGSIPLLESIQYPHTTQQIGFYKIIKKNEGLNLQLFAENSLAKEIDENVILNIMLKNKE